MIEVDLSILEIGGGGELIRTIAENLQILEKNRKTGQACFTTSLHYIGQPRHLLEHIENAQALGRYIFVAAHGDEQGLYFGDYGENIDVSMLQNGYLPYEIFFNKGQFQDKTVMNSACYSAGEGALEVFKPQKNFTYIGYSDAPDGDADILIFHKFLYELTHGTEMDIALERTRAICPDAKFLTKWN